MKSSPRLQRKNLRMASFTARVAHSPFFKNALLDGYETDRAKRLGISKKIELTPLLIAKRELRRAAKNKKRARRKMQTLARRAGRK
jgi:hypothetical protein